MLKILRGDLLQNVDSNAIIAHGCNMQGVMSSGFARSLAKRYPAVYDSYVAGIRSNMYTLGDVIAHVESKEKRLVIANCLTQETYGQKRLLPYVSYSALISSMVSVANLELPIHLPFVGAGLAGGEPKLLLEILSEVFEHVDATMWLP